MANRIEVIVDVITDKAQASFKSFKASVSEAEGATGKLSAAWKGAGNLIRENAAQIAVIGGAALVTFGVKAVAAFEDAAKAAVDTGKAMGDSTENASRWIAVGDDFKVAAEQIAAGGKEITKHLDDDKWDKYGIAVKDATGALRPTGDALKDILSTISAQKTPQDQARVGLELLGKAYKGLAPLVGHTREEYDQMLSSVEDGQVITDAEAEKAERMRLAQDALADALHEVTLKVGEEVASLAPLAEKLVDILDLIDKIGALNPMPNADDLGKTVDALDRITAAAIKSDDAVAYLNEHGFGNQAENLIARYIDKQKEAAAATKATAEAAEGLSPAQIAAMRAAERLADETGTLTDEQIALNDALAQADGVVGDAKDGYHAAETAATGFGQALDDLGQDSDELTASLNEQIEALKRLRDEELSAIDSKYAFEAANRDATAAIRDYNAVSVDAEATMQDVDDAAFGAGESVRGAAKAYAESTGAVEGSNGAIQAQIDYLTLVAGQLAEGSPLRQRIDGYISDLKGIPTEVTTAVGLESYDDTVEKLRNLNRILDDINRARNAAFSAHSDPKLPGRASGGPVSAGQAYVVGENRAEVFVPDQNGTILPTVPNGAGGVGTVNHITINMPPGSDGEDVVQAIKRFERRNGPGWRS